MQNHDFTVADAAKNLPLIAREEEMPERIQDLAEFDDISPIVGKMLPPPSLPRARL